MTMAMAAAPGGAVLLGSETATPPGLACIAAR